MKVPILAYHKVDTRSPTRFWVSADFFDMQMATLHELGYESVSLYDLWRSSHGDGILPAKPVCITFDDGYENFATRAFPVLGKHGFTATVFIPTDFIGDDERRWNDWDRSPEERSFPAAHLVWREIIELHRSGIEIGAHTRTHRDLESLAKTSPADAEEEITACKREIEARLSAEIGFLSYPYRTSGAAVEIMARKAGFLGAATMNGGFFDTQHDDWYRIDRIPVLSRSPGISPQEERDAFMALLSELPRNTQP